MPVLSGDTIGDVFAAIAWRDQVFPPVYGVTVTPDLTKGGIQYVKITDGVAFTLANPLLGTLAPAGIGIRWTLIIDNQNGGAHGTITLGSKIIGTIPAIATVKRRLFEFFYDPAADKHYLVNSAAPADL